MEFPFWFGVTLSMVAWVSMFTAEVGVPRVEEVDPEDIFEFRKVDFETS